MKFPTLRQFFVPLFLLGMFYATQASAVPSKLGDLDDDNTHTANDLAKLVAHSSGALPLAENFIPFADINQDGAVNSTDQEELIELILESKEPQALPLAKVRQTSPYADEGDVAVTRETVVHFTMPLSLTAALDTTLFYADANGRRILSNVQIASDRRKATLFYSEPLPSNTRVRVVMEGAGLNDLLGRSMDLDGDGVAGGNLIFTFDTLSITGLPGTGITGRVLASEQGPGNTDIPIAGATVMVDGAEETLRTTTDANGNFLLTPCPAGSFFVHVDGRTSPASNYPNGNYYPSVGKRWDAVAGRLDNESGNIQDELRGVVYLPIIEGAALTAVSATNETPVEFPEGVLDEHPELEGTRMVVPPNSLFADDGTRGGRVAIAPVDPNRLPSPLPPGLELPMVITIQTDGGSNFDIPVPITFPNLPDPVTGEKLPPGAKTALWSFNHDLGDWEIVGPMTVSDDGLFVTTDAGVGIRQPGWHGTQQGSGGNGGPPRTRPKPPPEDPPCPTKSAWDYGNLIYDVGKETASCAIEFAKAKEALKCVFTLVDLTKNLLVGAVNIKDALAKGEKAQAVESLLSIIEAQLARTEALMSCVKVGSPFSKATAAFECVGNALNVADGLCVFNDDPMLADRCRPGFGARKFCQGIQLARLLHTEIKVMVDFAKGAEEQVVLAGATAAVKHIKLLIETYRRNASGPATPGSPSPPPGDDVTMTPEQLAQIRLIVTDLEKDLLKIQEFAKRSEKLIEAMDAFQKQADGMVSEVAKDLTEFGEPIQRSSYYRATIDEVVQRGRTAPSGGLSLIMAPDARYELSLYDPVSKEIGSTLGATGANGSNIDLNSIAFQSTSGMIDTDNDGLVDQAESIINTKANDSDSDDDGILDGAEVEQGSDPNGGLISQTGIIATVPQTAPSQHITTANNMAVISHRAAGVSIYNIANPLTPSLIQLYDTPGAAEAAVIAGNLIAVADTSSVVILDATNPSNIVQRHLVTKSNTDFVSIATDGVLVYAGTNNGKIQAIDLASGSILGEVSLSDVNLVQDVTVWRGRLYALQVGKLTTINLDTLTITGTLPLVGNMGAGQRRWRLFAGDGTLYATHTSGFNIVDTATTPNTPTLVSNFNTGAFGWKQIVSTGNGLGVAAVSPNSTDDGPHNIDLYTLGADQRTPAYNITFVTPGLAAAVSLFNGLAYVADSGTGLQVLSFKAFDSLGIPPAITLTATPALNESNHTGEIESGKPFRIYATATDDVQVRNVEFYVDDVLSQTDGSYPFEGGFNAPSRSPSKTSFTIRAKVSDTGGNTTWSNLYTVTLLPDIIPPVVKRTYPSAIGGLVKSVLGIFNEPLDPATVTTSSVLLTFAGPDGIIGNGDDTPVTADSLVYRDDINAISFNKTDILPQGLYRGRLTTAIKDASGNALANDHVWNFNINNSSSIFVPDTDGVYSWNDGANWSTGTAPGPGSTVIIDAGPGVQINMNSGTLEGVTLSIQGGARMVLKENVNIGNVTINGDLRVEGYAYLNLTGNINFDNGRLILVSTNAYLYAVAEHSVSFTGTGEVLIEGNYATYFYGFESLTLEAGVTLRLRGNTAIGYNLSSTPFTTLGNVIVDHANAYAYLYKFDNKGTFSLSNGLVAPGQGFTNTGTLELSATGELMIYDNFGLSNLASLGTITRAGGNGGQISLGGVFDLQGSTLALTAGTGSWNLKYGTLKNGIVTTVGGASLRVPTSYYGTLEDIDLQGTLNLASGSYLYLDGAWQNHGVINLDRASLYLDGTFLLSSMGTINPTNESKVQITGVIDNTGLTMDPGSLPNFFSINAGTVKGGNVGTGSASPVIMPDSAYWKFDGVTLTSELRTGSSAQLEVSNGLTLNNVNVVGKSLTTQDTAYLYLYLNGTQTVGGTGSFIFDDTNIANATLYINVQRLYNSSSGQYEPAHATFGPNISMRLKDGYLQAYGSDVQATFQGTLDVPVTNGYVTWYGRINNTGTLNVSKGTLALENEIYPNGPAHAQPWTNTGTINLSSTGTLRMGGTFTLAQLGVVNRTGGKQVIHGTLDLTPAGTLALNATTGSWELLNSGTIKGGTVTTTGGSTLQIAASQQGQLDGTTFQGTINIVGGTLTMLGDWTNQGVINLDNATMNCGGEFVVADLGTINRTTSNVYITGILDNTATTFQIDNPTLVWGASGTIKGGTITCSSPTFSPNQNFYNQVMDGVTVASSFVTRGSMYIRNGITVNTGVTIRSEGTAFYVLNSSTFNGAGTLLFANQQGNNNYIIAYREAPYTTPTVVTLSPTFKVLAEENVSMYSYYSYVGNDTGDKIINQGEIRVETNGKVVDIRRPFQNDGQLLQANGGTVNVHD